LWQKLVLKRFNVNFSGSTEWNYEDALKMECLSTYWRYI